MSESSAAPVPRWRRILFWLSMVVLLFLQVGESPESLGWPVAAFGGFPVGDGATHEIHWFTIGTFTWVVVLAILVQLRRAATQIGAAWSYGLGSVLVFGLVLALADLPPEIAPILMGALVVGAAAFLLHPSSMRAKVTAVEPRSPLLFGLVVLAAIPLVIYAAGQLEIHHGSGPADEHFEFGHWVVMGVFGLYAPLLAAVAATKVAGWRFPLWASGVLVAAFGVASLGINAVSQLTTLWAVLAIAWGVVFIAAGELEHRRNRAATVPSTTRAEPVAAAPAEPAPPEPEPTPS